MDSIGNFGDGSGYLYEQNAAGYIESWPNNTANAMKVWDRAYKSAAQRKEYFMREGTFLSPDQFYDPVYGSRFYINTTGVIGSITSAVEITNDLVPNNGNYTKTVTLAADVLTTERFTPMMIVSLNPQSGASDSVKTITEGETFGGGNIGFVTSDIIIVTAANPDHVFTFVDQSQAGGDNLFLRGGINYAMTGYGASIAFRKRSGTTSGWEELWRSGSDQLQVIAKTLVAGGGTWNLITDATDFATQSRVLVKLTGGEAITDPWIVTADDRFGQEFEILPFSSSTLNGGSVTVMGIEINEFLLNTASWMVKSYFDPTTEAYISKLVFTEIDQAAFDMEGDIATINATNCSSSTVSVKKSISAAVESFGLVEYVGNITMAVTLAYGAGAKTIFSSMLRTWKPRQTKRWLCEVTNGGNEGNKIAVVEVLYTGVIQVYAVTGFNLVVGDVIDLSCISYVAYETPAP